MINLMYLVLIAMLALNVSAEIINAFFMIDKGIASTNNIIDDSNEFATKALEKNAEQDLSRYQPLVDAAKEVRQISAEFNDYITGIRDTLVASSGGMYPEDDDKHAGQPKGYKNKDVTTRLLVDQGKGDEIEQRILSTRQQLLDIVTRLKDTPGTSINDETIAALEESISLEISDDWENAKAGKKNKSWARYTFFQMPLAAIFPIFRKFQNDMKSSEAAVLNYLVQQVGAETFKVDNFIPIASASKSYVIAGEPYEAEITIGASSKSVYENMDVKVNGQSLSVEDGIAKYSARATSTGVKSYKVDIDLTNPTTGKRETYSKTFEYEVGRRSVTVAADKMNVLYIGVENPISVAAAGVSSNDLRVSGSGSGIQMSRTGEGKYNATVSTPGTANITVSGGGLQASSFEFRVKRIPDPVARLSNSSGGDMPNGEFRAQGGVGAFLDNFDFDARCVVSGFELIYVARRQDPIPVTNAGARYTSEAQALIARAKPGDIYYFDNVRAKCPGDQSTRKINTMVFNIR